MKRLIMLAAQPALLLAGCAAQPAASGTETLTVTGSYPLQYAQQFTIDECEGGYYLITIDGTRYLVVPEGENAPAELDADITVLQQPIESIYLVSSSATQQLIVFIAVLRKFFPSFRTSPPSDSRIAADQQEAVANRIATIINSVTDPTCHRRLSRIIQ